jgi:hypothetical protein
MIVVGVAVIMSVVVVVSMMVYVRLCLLIGDYGTGSK